MRNFTKGSCFIGIEIRFSSAYNDNIPCISPICSNDMFHSCIHIPKGGVGHENETFAAGLESIQDLFEVRSGVEIFAGIFGNETVKVATNVSTSHTFENIIDDIGRIKRNFSGLEEVDRVGNETAFGHAKQIIQGFKALLSLLWSHGPFSRILGYESGTGYLVSPLPCYRHLMRIGQVTNPSRFSIDRQPSNAKSWIKFEPRIEHFQWILVVSDQSLQCHIVNELQQLLIVCDQRIIIIKSHRTDFAQIYIGVGKDSFMRIQQGILDVLLVSVVDRNFISIEKRLLLLEIQGLDMQCRHDVFGGFQYCIQTLMRGMSRQYRHAVVVQNVLGRFNLIHQVRLTTLFILEKWQICRRATDRFQQRRRRRHQSLIAIPSTHGSDMLRHLWGHRKACHTLAAAAE
mmetsp:Transcript_27942/g.50872  ORF Transcript_27942/g.50872 Transcript_27942/m.50872 type:complete len:401 (+) Transcript_27942:2027-3229(+)